MLTLIIISVIMAIFARFGFFYSNLSEVVHNSESSDPLPSEFSITQNFALVKKQKGYFYTFRNRKYKIP